MTERKWELVCSDGKTRHKPIAKIRHAWAEARKSEKFGCARGCPRGEHKVVMYWTELAHVP